MPPRALPDLEQALRRDLADAVKSSDVAIRSSTASRRPPRIRSTSKASLTRLTGADLSTAQAAYADYGSLHAELVDGIHAETEMEVSSVIGNEIVQARGECLPVRQRRGRHGSAIAPLALLHRVDLHPGRIASKKQSAILHAAGPNGGTMRGDSVAAMWPTLEVIRDIYSQASARCRADVGNALGRAHRVSCERLRATRHPNRIRRAGARRCLPSEGGHRLRYPARVAGRLVAWLPPGRPAATLPGVGHERS